MISLVLITQITSQIHTAPKIYQRCQKEFLYPFFPTNFNSFGILSAPFHDMPKLGMFLYSRSSIQAQKHFAKHLKWNLLAVNLQLLSLGMMNYLRISLVSNFSLVPLFNSVACK